MPKQITDPEGASLSPSQIPFILVPSYPSNVLWPIFVIANVKPPLVRLPGQLWVQTSL